MTKFEAAGVSKSLKGYDSYGAKNVQIEKTNWSWMLVYTTLLTTIGTAVPVGYNIGVINSPASIIRDWCNDIIRHKYATQMDSDKLSILWSVIVSALLIGGAIGSLTGGWICHRFGRKKCILLTGFLFVLSGSLFYLCRIAGSVEMLLIGRLIAGLASGFTTSSLPIYHTELAPLFLRGTLGVFCSLGVTAGVVVGQIVSLREIWGTEQSWHYALSGYLILVILCYAGSFYFPESPQFLYIIRNEKEKSILLLQKLRGKQYKDINNEINDMESARKLKVKTRNIFAVLSDPSLLLPIVIVCCFQGGQQLSGINAVFYYSVSIFEEAGLTKQDAEWANLGAGTLNLMTAFFTPILMRKINRRPLMMVSCAVSSIALFGLTFIIHFIDFLGWLPIACIACILLYIFFYQVGLGPIPYFIGSEIVSLESRPAVMSLGSLSSWFCNFIVALSFPTLQSSWNAFIFLPFSTTCIILFVLTKYYLPETRDRDLPDIIPLLTRGFRIRLTSSVH